MTRNSKEVVKSPACKKVLQLMDEDKTYQEALEIVLAAYAVTRKSLEDELNYYI